MSDVSLLNRSRRRPRPRRNAEIAAGPLLVAIALVAGGCGANQPPPTPTEVIAAPPATTASGQRSTTPAPDRTPATAQPAIRQITLGRSVQGRPITATAIGDPNAPRSVLVVGVIHGDETAGRSVTSRLTALRPPAGTQLWIVDTVNPDGESAGTRTNADGVDLNRNSGYRWRPREQRGSRYWSGPGPWSEPESRIIRDLVARVGPTVSVWYHQPYGLVDDSGGDPAVAAAYADSVGLPFKRLDRYPGSVTSWQNADHPGTTAFVVEFPAGDPPAAVAVRHVAAIRAMLGPGTAGAGQPEGEGAGASPAGAAIDSLRPPIRTELIPFPASRRAEMADYGRRHYGLSTYRLEQPRLIVEHVASVGSAAATRAIFAPDKVDPELKERPNVCAHFVIDTDGTILQLVPLGIMCRHVVGLNYTAVGIEHAGFADSDVLDRSQQLDASLRLTRWLRCRFGLSVDDVIGHGESLSSPYYRERVARFRGQTHSDFSPASMQRYRSALARLPCP